MHSKPNESSCVQKYFTPNFLHVDGYASGLFVVT